VIMIERDRVVVGCDVGDNRDLVVATVRRRPWRALEGGTGLEEGEGQRVRCCRLDSSL